MAGERAEKGQPMTESLLSLELSVAYSERGRVLDGLRLKVDAGESVGLAGQSGTGKSTLSLAMLGLLDRRRARVTGHARFRGQDLLTMRGDELRKVRGRHIGYVPQSPLSSLNPALRIGEHFREAWEAHQARSGEWREAAGRTLVAVSLPDEDEFLRLYPWQLSVGLGQRVLIGLAILHEPELLIADEPTSALDLVTRAEILALLRRLNEDRHVATLHISHDLYALASSCRRLAVMAEGRIVEEGSARSVLSNPAHSYTRKLVGCLRGVEDLEPTVGR